MAENPRLILFRHGLAEERAPGVADAQRALTDQGVKRTRQAARGLARFAPKPDVLLASPKRRARQTAEILGKAFEIKPVVLPELGQEHLPRLIRKLTGYGKPVICAVGHEPMFSRLASLLCTGDQDSMAMVLKKAGAVCLELVADPSGESFQGRLLWLATPGMLRQMKK